MTQNYFSEKSPIQITGSEINELQDFLLLDAVPEGAMTLDSLDGFFTALVIGPAIVPANIWFPHVWDMTGGGELPNFENPEQADRILELLIKMMNSIATRLSGSAEYYAPLPDTTGLEDGEVKDLLIKIWASGFMIGVNCIGSDWVPLVRDKKFSILLSSIYTLSFRPNDPVPLPSKTFREVWENVSYCVMAIDEFWNTYRQQEQAKAKGVVIADEAERTGRNEPCPCGSGKKFKKCCGR
ncbi:MAG: UPF0149 family protein [Candidatus Omnitrophota bacterium]